MGKRGSSISLNWVAGEKPQRVVMAEITGEKGRQLLKTSKGRKLSVIQSPTQEGERVPQKWVCSEGKAPAGSRMGKGGR